MSEAIDLFCHWITPKFGERARAMSTRPMHMLNRALEMPVMVDLEARFRVMDEFLGYAQVPSLASPPPDAIGNAAVAIELCRIGNDEQAEIVARYPDRFPGFVAALPMSDPEAAQAEATRAVRDLGAVGVQIFTNINGAPLDEAHFLDVLRHIDTLDRPVWLHPTRGIEHADYRTERISKFDLWWAMGWPYETSAAIGRLVFSAILEECPDLQIITHHAGGMVPMLEGRIASGLALLGTRCPPGMEMAVKTRLQGPPVEIFKRFFADTATFGSRAAIECALDFFGLERIVFASDMPFDPQQGAGYIRSTLRAIAELQISVKEREQILSGNARRICRLSASPIAGRRQ